MQEDLIARRRRLMGPNVPTFYDRPLHIVGARGVWLQDASGRRYLDCYNNVPHVGHCHPRVVEAISRQAATLNTHTRYLHTGILDYIEALTAHLSHGLAQVIMVCTGSEANDIALRMAQAVTGNRGLVATDSTYHGNTTAVSQLSARRPPIGGYPEHVRLVPAPDALPGGLSGREQAHAFAANVARAIAQLEQAGFGLAGMMLDPIFANEGLPELPEDFLAPAIAVIRGAGGLVLCDEIQPGFGRVGTHWWGHERTGFAPDVVTLGKPMANGHPVAAVVTRADIMESFRGSFGYFNTFGGNPVSCAAAMATLRVIEEEGLLENAARVGGRMLEHLRALDHACLARVNGHGLFLSAEVIDTDGAPSGKLAHRIVEAMKARGVLIGRIGRHENVLKFRPPMVIGPQEADMAMDALRKALDETAR